VGNEEVLQGDKDEKNILHTVKGRKDKWIGHILSRNCLLNTLLKEIEKEGKKLWEDEAENVSS